MLDSFLKNREAKTLEKVDEHFKKALELVDGRLYKQAMIQFKKAIDLDRPSAYPRLVLELENFSRSGNMEGALAVGLNLLKDNSEDYELANKLGNYAREIKDYKQANNLYKHSLKANKGYEFAKFNLAASMARVDKYDENAISAVTKFDEIKDYILPEYYGNPELVDNIEATLKVKKKLKQEEKLQSLLLEKETLENSAEASSEDIEAKEAQIGAVKKESGDATPDEILDYFDELITQNEENADEHRFNKGLYCLQIKKVEIGRGYFQALLDKNASFEYLKMCLAIADALEGKIEEASNTLIKRLGEERYNRYYNVNLGLIYRKMGNKLLSYKYLILSSWLLERSNGYYNLSDVIRIADEKFSQSNYREALKLYKIAASETRDPKIWENIGEIYLKQKKHSPAVASYRKVLELKPTAAVAKIRLKEIHDFFLNKGDALFQELKYKPAADNYQKALEVLRLPDTIKKTAIAFKQLKRHDKEQELMDEWFRLMENKKNEEKEKDRLNNILQAKKLIKAKQYLKAVDLLESSFRMKLDKDVFLQLAALYKGLKKMGDLQDLLIRWNKMVEHEEKMKKYEKLQERTQSQD